MDDRKCKNQNRDRRKGENSESRKGRGENEELEGRMKEEIKKEGRVVGRKLMKRGGETEGSDAEKENRGNKKNMRERK